MRMQPQTRTESQWNTQERLRYYHMASNPFEAMVEGGPPPPPPPPPPLRSAAGPDCSQRQMMFAAHNALRGYTYLDWKSGLTSNEPSDWWHPIEYKRCLTEWTTSRGYFLGGGGGGGGGGGAGGEWTVEEGYQKCPEFIPTDEGRMLSFGRHHLPKSFKGGAGEDPSSPWDDRPPTSFDNNSYSSVVPYSSHSMAAAALCLRQPDVIHPTSTLSPLSPANPQQPPPPSYGAPLYNNAPFTQTEGQPCVVSVSCCSALAPPSLLSASADRVTIDRRGVGCPSQAVPPVHGWTVSHSWQQQQQQQSKRLTYCYQDLMPNRLENPSSHLLTQSSFSLDPYMQYYSYSGCHEGTDSSEELPIPPPPPLCCSIENRMPDGSVEMGFNDSGMCSIEDCDSPDDILHMEGSGRGNGGARHSGGTDGGPGVSFEFPFGPIVSQLNPTT